MPGSTCGCTAHSDERLVRPDLVSPLRIPAPPGRGHRNMAEVDAGGGGTVFLNAAVVPRIQDFPVPPPPAACLEPPEPRQPHESSYDSSYDEGDVVVGGTEGVNGGGTVRGHHFLMVELQGQVVAAAHDVWVGVQAAGGSGQRRCSVLQQQELVKTSLPAADGTAAAGSSGGAAEQLAEGQYVCSIYRAFTGEWEPFVLPLPAGVQAAP